MTGPLKTVVKPSPALEINQRIRAELLELLFRQAGKSAIAGNLIAILIVIGLFNTTNHYLLMGWYLSNLFFSAIWQNILIYNYRHRDSNDQRVDIWVRWFNGGVILAACSWSFVGFYLLPLQTFNYQAFLIIFMLGIATASNTVYSFIRLAYISFVVIELLPLSIILMMHGDLFYILIGAAVFIYIGVMIVASLNTYKMLTDTLKLHFEKKELQEAKQKLEILNEDLSVEIKRREKIEQMLEHLATHDALTGLPNRALFQNKLSHAFSNAAEKKQLVGILFIDLDNFKKVNDLLGHNLGDELLTRVGLIFQSLLREADVVARLGGDEFTVIVDSAADVQSIEAVAKKICEVFTTGIQVGTEKIYITASVGISLFPNDGVDLSTLIKNADIALYHAKACGKNNYQFYNNELTVNITRRQILETDLHNAIARQEFEVYYQPLVDLKTNSIIGAEALIRWHHPTNGLVAPVDFISFTEENGLIVPIGEWVLRQACEQCKIWQAVIPTFYISVNLSPKQVTAENFTQRTAMILQDTQLEGQYLDLEITESLLIQDIEVAFKVITSLKKLGIKISLDDFGTGYSSMSYLKRFPIDKLKIDRSFIKGIPDDINDVAITQAILSLGRTLNLMVTAEGVEDIAQHDFVRNNNCNVVQGYYLSPPLTRDDFRLFMNNHP